MAKELMHLYSQQQDLVDSTAAARINGYIGGHGTKGQLMREIEKLGLSPDGIETLLGLVRD